MSIEITMPQMGESITEGTVTRWMKQVGDYVERDEPLFEISTDKVDAEIPSPVSGILTRIIAKEGVTVAIDAVVALMNQDGIKPATKIKETVPASNKQMVVPSQTMPVERKQFDKATKQHNIIHCVSWQKFKSAATTEMFGKEPFERGVYLFRGHGSSYWPLISTFDRWFKEMGVNKAYKVKASEKLIQLFQKESEGMSIEKWIWEDEVARLALAQHHGIPTRLLDWTESPYIAAFFAFAGIALAPKPDQYVAVWCLDTRSEIWSKEFGAEILEVPSYGNERLRSQLGKFTLLRAPFDTLEEYVSNFEEAGDALSQFLIPSSEALIALSDLDVMGINYSKIFPGLEGCARAARLRMLFNK